MRDKPLYQPILGIKLSCCSGYDFRQREWHHLDTCQFKRSSLQIFHVRPDAGFTAWFERPVIDWLKEANIKAVAEHKLLLSGGDARLVRNRDDGLKHLGGVSRKQWSDFKALRATAIKTARAWALKEHASLLWNYVSRTGAEKAWKKLLGWMSRRRLPSLVKLAKTLRKHL